MATNSLPDPTKWINVRTTEPEFLEFLGAASQESAKQMALAKCSATSGQLSADLFTKFKADYLRWFSAKLNLPISAGRLS